LASLKQLLLLPQSAPSGSQSPDVNAGKKRRVEMQGLMIRKHRQRLQTLAVVLMENCFNGSPYCVGISNFF